MASPPQTFQSFLFAAAVAGIGVGGGFLVSWVNSDKQTSRDIAVLQSMLDRTNKEVDALRSQQNILISLGVRVTVVEGYLSRQEVALEELRKYKVPTEMRDKR